MAKKNHKPDLRDKAIMTVECTPYMEKLLKETFNCEIEMLQGTVEDLPDGRKKYVFEVEGEKAELMGTFVLRVISKSHQANKN